MFRITSKTKIPLLPVSTSDDDDKQDDISPVLCSAHENNGYFSIFSEKQCDYPIHFGSGSFAFHYNSDEILICFHPMFLWRYIHTQKTKEQITSQTDYVRMLSIASQHMRGSIQITVRKKYIQYGSRQILYDKFPLVLGSFNHLYRALIREYEASNLLTEMLGICFNLYLLCSVNA